VKIYLWNDYDPHLRMDTEFGLSVTIHFSNADEVYVGLRKEITGENHGAYDGPQKSLELMLHA
jgi:hypothetical protein